MKRHCMLLSYKSFPIFLMIVLLVPGSVMAADNNGIYIPVTPLFTQLLLNKFTYETVTSSGQIWMDRNLGASQVATSPTDSQAYGDLYQWGRGTDGHEKRNSSMTTDQSTSDNPYNGNFIIVTTSPYDWRIPPNDNLWQSASGINNPCPAGFRLPTDTELDTERASWDNNNATSAYESPLKFTMSGYRARGDGIVKEVGKLGYYWSNTIIGMDTAASLSIDSGSAMMDDFQRSYGFSVRCIQD